MVGVAQAVERLTVDQVVVGSNPITHPISYENIENGATEPDGCRFWVARLTKRCQKRLRGYSIFIRGQFSVLCVRSSIG